MEDLNRNIGEKIGETKENESISVSYLVTYQKNTTRNNNVTPSAESFKMIIDNMEKEIFEIKEALKLKMEEQELLKSIYTQSKSELADLDNELERDESRLELAQKRLICLEREQSQLNEEMKRIEGETAQMKENTEEVKNAYRNEVEQLALDLQKEIIKYRNLVQLNNGNENQNDLVENKNKLIAKATQLEEDVKNYENILNNISASGAQKSEEHAEISRNIKYLKMCLKKELDE